MAEIKTLVTLERKAAEIEKIIGQYEARLAQAKADLAAVRATIALFKGEGETESLTPYVRSQRLLGRGEAFPLVVDALGRRSPQSTRQLAEAIMKAKGLDVTDKVLARAIAGRLIHILVAYYRRRKLAEGGRKGNARLWKLAS